MALAALKRAARHAVRVAHAVVRERAKRVTRSSKWRAVERYTIKAARGCAACQGTKRLQVHHKQPFHLHPELELDARNLIVLCMGSSECHLLIGHGDSFKAWNPNVEADARAVREGADPAAVAARAKAARRQ